MNELIKGKNVALIIITYNRPDYLAKCLESVKNLSPQPTSIVIVDDASTDPLVREIIFNKGFVDGALVTFHEVNSGVKECIITGFTVAKYHREGGLRTDLFIVLDGDAIVKPNAMTRLVDMHLKYGNITSGFNTHNIKNPIEETGDGCVFKKHVNGINVCFDKDQYEKYIEPALNKEGNWDYNTSLNYQADGKLFTITAPSVVQHIGLVSSMGHTNNGVKADTSYDFD